MMVEERKIDTYPRMPELVQLLDFVGNHAHQAMEEVHSKYYFIILKCNTCSIAYIAQLPCRSKECHPPINPTQVQ